MEKFLEYFGKYTPAADGAVATFKIEYLTSLLVAAFVIFMGRAMVRKFKFLKKYAIPAPVVSGLLLSIVISIIKGAGIIGLSFDKALIQDLCQNIFFLCVGFGFSAKMLKKAGGKLCGKIAIAACLIITLQNILGLLIGKAIGLHPLLALQCSSSAMSGGVGTASAFGATFEAAGVASAVTIGVAAATLGNVMGSLIGGPVGAFLINRNKLKPDPNDRPEGEGKGKVVELNANRLISAFALILLLAGLGMPIYALLDNIPYIEMPKFIGCIFAGAIGRNVMEALNIEFYTPEIDAIEHMFLELYLALVLMSIDITALIPVAGKMGVILLAQGLLVAAFAIFVSYRMFGKNYGAAVMAAGNVGWACGSGSNAVANEKAIMDQYGWHTIAWVLYPSFAVIIDDIYNPIILSILGSILK
ncbi:sodium/glutamate symporter [uncultured Clostridium sp.]|uniref:sodium/glutamate symporter n=1 Tax=uncultured Clostridium sp. TaxID=59620 RepID=UPI003217B61A